MILDWAQTLQAAEGQFSRGKFAPAIEEYRKLASSDPSDLRTLNTLGDLYVRAGLTEQARLMFSRVAQGYRDQGFTSKAIAIFKKLLRIDPADLGAAVSLADCYVAQGLLGEASRQYAVVAEAYTRAGREGKALDIYQRMAEIDPSNTTMQLTLGERLISEGRTHRAHACFTAAGDEFSRQGDLKQAFLAYLKAQAAQPDDQKTLAAIAEICAARGDAETAVPILHKALSRNPGDAELHRILGSAYLSAGRLNDAARTFQTLLALDRSSYRDLLIVAERFIEAGELDLAVETINGCVDSLIADRNEKEAIALLQKALDRDPEHSASLRRLAHIFRRLCDDFNLAPTLRALANSALRRGDRDEATEALKELCFLEPTRQEHRDAIENLEVEDPATPLAICSTPTEPRKDEQPANLRSAQLTSHTESNDSTALFASALPGGEPDSLELDLALRRIYAGESLLNPAPRQRSHQSRICKGEWSLRVPAPEFVAADDIRGRTSFSQHGMSKPAPSGTARDFQFFTPGDRRLAARESVRVPVVVISDTGGWREFTETVDVSESGLRFKLVHPVPPMTMLRVVVRPAKRPDSVGTTPALNPAKGIVRHCVSRQGRPNLVGIELDLTTELPAVETFAASDSV